MIRIVAVVDRFGRLRRLDVEGHAGIGGERGDPACAGVSVLARTAARVVAGKSGFVVDGGHGGPGSLSFAIRRKKVGGGWWLRGVTATLMTGLADLAEEFPAGVSMTVVRERKREGKRHGA